MSHRIIFGSLCVCACLTPLTLGQTPCGVRSTYRIVTNMSGATGPGELVVNLPWTAAAPALGAGSITTTNPTGQSSSMTVDARAEYGRMSLVASGSATCGMGIGVFFWLDEYFGGAPKAESSDTWTVVSDTLPAGTPVNLLFTLTMEGSATLVDSAPVSSYSAILRVDSPGTPGAVLNTGNGGIGTQAMVFPTFVGQTLTVYSGLYASFHANGVLGGGPNTASLECDLRSRVSVVVQTAGARLTTCSGASYDPTPPCGTADFDGDGDVGTDQDIEAFFSCLAGSCCAACWSADFNGDGDTGTDADIEAFFRVLAGGHC